MTTVILNGVLKTNELRFNMEGKWHFFRDFKPKNTFFYQVFFSLLLIALFNDPSCQLQKLKSTMNEDIFQTYQQREALELENAEKLKDTEQALPSFSFSFFFTCFFLTLLLPCL